MLKKRFSFFLTFFIFSSLHLFAAVPKLVGRINDYAGVMNEADKMQAEKYLSSLEDATSIQIAVLTIGSLNGEDLESYSYQVAESWGLGQKGEDNGVLLLVAMAEKKVRIEVGYGLEGKLTDTKSGLIIRNVILPDFRNGNFSLGILNGVKNISGILGDDAELVSKKVTEKKRDKGLESFIFGLLIMFGWFVLFSCIASGKENHWLPWIIFTPTFRKNHPVTSSPSDNFSFGGSSGFGSSGSGGFSGGGGHFGGGGASGGW